MSSDMRKYWEVFALSFVGAIAGFVSIAMPFLAVTNLSSGGCIIVIGLALMWGSWCIFSPTIPLWSGLHRLHYIVLGVAGPVALVISLLMDTASPIGKILRQLGKWLFSSVE